MATVDLRPGDTLNIVWTSLQETPFGSKEVESSFVFSYEELLQKLRTRGRGSRVKQKTNSGIVFSRVVSLTANAMKKGKWSTGAEIDRNLVFDKMLSRFRELGAGEYRNVTENAREALQEMHTSKTLLKPAQRKSLENLMNLIGIKA